MEELEYSDNALLNKDLFFENDINFYIEDRGKEYRYANIFKELFKVKIERVFALDGKNNLKKKYKELKDNNNLDNSFFIADSDFDFLLEKDIIKNQHFIYLEKYEIENYILDEKAIIIYLIDKLQCMETTAKELLNYESWISETSNKSYKLFILYLIVQMLNIGVENTEENSNKYFDETGSVNISKINKYYEDIKEKLNIMNKNIDVEITKMEKIIKDKCDNDYSKIIRGKYLIVGMRKYLSNIISKKENRRVQIKEQYLIDYLFNFFDKRNLLFIRKKVEDCLKHEGNM